MTLRTLCQETIIRQRVVWQNVVPPILMEPIDEVDKHRIYQEIEEVQQAARQGTKRKREGHHVVDKRQRWYE